MWIAAKEGGILIMPTKIEQQLHDAEITVEFEDAREETLVRQACMGQDTHDWLSSDVGRWVIGAALQDQVEIEEKLISVKPNTPWRRRKITELQQKHEAIGMAVGWLSESVKLGMAAVRDLNNPDE